MNEPIMTDSIATSFPDTADIETSSDKYAERFSGAAGQWMLGVQERITMAFVAKTNPSSILDVGGGHGQLAVPLCEDGHKVTVLGSAESCRKRIKTVIESGQCEFKIGNMTELPFPDRSFDTVISFRLLAHCSRWPQLVKELCRVAKNDVVIDYPTSQSLNRIAPLLFKAKKKFEGDTRTWALFRHRDVIDAFRCHGFELRRKKGQFFLPMVLHRALKCRTLSVALEGICHVLGLTALWGSPAIVWLTRKGCDN